MNQQLRQLAGRFSWRQRIFMLAAAVAVVAAMVAFTRWRHERDFRPLFTQLAPEDAAAVTAKLAESGTEYRLADNGAAVLAPSARVAELRLQLAGAGLPRTGRAGFELFDKTSFGVTDFAEHINYRRALEGELERSVASLAEVAEARVHLTFPKESVFVEARQPAKASVLMKLRPGARLAPPQVVAVTHLVASAVEGLTPEAVSVLDMSGNLLSRPRRSSAIDGEPPSEAMLEFKQQVERDLLLKIQSTLEPLVGPDKFRAGVSADCDFSSGEQSEEVFDPTRSVMASSQKTEDLGGTSLASGVPGTASALPQPTSPPGSGTHAIERRTENVTYQTSRTVKRVRLPQGKLERMSIAVLLDQDVRWEGKGAQARRIIEPPPPEKVQQIRALVAAATGFVAERGDQLTVETLPFDATLHGQPPDLTPAAAPVPATLGVRLPDLPQAVLIGAGAGLALLLLLAVVARLALRGRKKNKAPRMRATPASGAAQIEGGKEPAARAGEPLEARLAEQQALKEKLEAEALSQLKLPPVTTKKAEVLSKHLVESAKKDPAGAAQILRTWLYDIEK